MTWVREDRCAAIREEGQGLAVQQAHGSAGEVHGEKQAGNEDEKNC